MDFVLVGAFAFALGLGIGVISQYIHDVRYTSDIKKLYEKMVSARDERIKVQNESIDRLIKINNEIQSSRNLVVNEVRYPKRSNEK